METGDLVSTPWNGQILIGVVLGEPEDLSWGGCVRVLFTGRGPIDIHTAHLSLLTP